MAQARAIRHVRSVALDLEEQDAGLLPAAFAELPYLQMTSFRQ